MGGKTGKTGKAGMGKAGMGSTAGMGSSGGLHAGQQVSVKPGCGIQKQTATLTAHVESTGDWVVELRNGRLRSFPESCLAEIHRDHAALKHENDKLRELLHVLGSDGDFDYYTESNINLRMRIKDRIRMAKAEEQIAGGDFGYYGHHAQPYQTVQQHVLPAAHVLPAQYHLPPQYQTAPHYQTYPDVITIEQPAPVPYTTYVDPHASFGRTAAAYTGSPPVDPALSQYVGTNPNPAFAQSQYVYEPQQPYR